MSNNKSINVCENCGQPYCLECSTHLEWDKYCSEKCVDEFRKEEKDEKE